MDIAVNYSAILVAGIISMGIGFLWYSPAVLGNPWLKLMGIDKKSMKKAQKDMAPLFALSFVATLMTGYVLSHVMALSEDFYGKGPVMAGISTAIFMWLGFIMPVQLTDVIFGSRKWMLFLINTGYQLASVLAMGIAIGVM